MSDLDQSFQQAIENLKGLDVEPDDNTKLHLYALYKQATVGDVQGEKPGFFDFVGAAKYSAWEELKGMPQDEAKQKYIDAVNMLTG